MPTQKFTVLTLPNLIRTLKGAAYLLAIVCGISASFLALLLLINLPVFDEELHPDLAKALPTAALPSADNNAYYGLIGFRAAPGKDFIATGQALVQRYLDNRATRFDTLTSEDYAELLGSDPLDVKFLLEKNCHLPAGTRLPVCSLEQIGTAMREGDYDRTRMDLTLQRYDALLAMSALRYMGDTTALTPPPSYQPILNAQKYKLGERYNTGTSTAFLNQVAADLKFWKLLLRDGRWLIDKMIAVSALWTDMRLLSEYIAEHELSAEDRALIDGFLLPLNAEELDIGEAFLAEAQDLHNLLANLRANPQYEQYSVGIVGVVSRLQLRVTLPNASANLSYVGTFKPLIALSQLSAADYMRTVDSPQYKATVSAQHKLSLSPANLYNLGGKAFDDNPTYPGGEAYIGRIHDLNAMLLAVRLQFELKGTAREQLAEKIQNSSITQPYTGAAFHYEAAEGWLAFECRDNVTKINLRCRVKL